MMDQNVAARGQLRNPVYVITNMLERLSSRNATQVQGCIKILLCLVVDFFVFLSRKEILPSIDGSGVLILLECLMVEAVESHLFF